MEDIKLAIIKRLADDDPDATIYDEQLKQGFKEPCFFVLSVDGAQRKGINRRRKRTAMFDVHYFPPGDTASREACERMAVHLYELLKYVEWEARTYRAESLKHQVIDGVLHFFLVYNVHTMLEKPAIDAMQSVEMEVHTK